MKLTPLLALALPSSAALSPSRLLLPLPMQLTPLLALAPPSSAALSPSRLLLPRPAAPRAPRPTCSSPPPDAESVFEVSLRRPLGLHFEERDGRVCVALVLPESHAASQGVRPGDVVLATSASLGTQMWPKSTVEGVNSAVRTRVDGVVRLRLYRAASRPPCGWEGGVRQTYEVELCKPLGLLLRQLPPDEEAGVVVAEISAGGSAAASGLIRVGDRLLATSASVGEQMWPKSTLEGALSALSTRLALCSTVRLRFLRVDTLGAWAHELSSPSPPRALSAAARSSLRSQWRHLRARPSVSPELAAALRNITLPSVRSILARTDRRRGGGGRRHSAADGRAVHAALRRLRRARVPLDCGLASALMTAALRSGQPRVALRAFEQLVEEEGHPDAQVYTTLIRVYAALGQRHEALAVLQRMRADSIAPSVKTYNALMAVCAAAGDRRGMLAHLAALRAANLSPTVASWNIILDYCAEHGAADVPKVFEKMRSEGVAADSISYATMIKAYASRRDLRGAAALLDQMEAEGIPPDVVVLNTMLGAYASARRREAAHAVFTRLCAHGVRPDALSYSLLLRASAHSAPAADAATAAMRAAGFRLGARDYAALLAARARGGDLAGAARTLSQMEAEGARASKYSYAALIDAAVRAKDGAAAAAFFDGMVRAGIAADAVSYTLRLRGFLEAEGGAGGVEAALALLDEMEAAGGECAPNAITFNALLAGCVATADGSLVRRAIARMLSRRIAPNWKTYRLLAAPPPVPPHTPPHAAAARQLEYLLGVIDEFEAWGRQLNGEVYLRLLAVCAEAPRGAAVGAAMAARAAVGGEATRGEKPTFVLRKGQRAEAQALEAALLRRAELVEK